MKLKDKIEIMQGQLNFMLSKDKGLSNREIIEFSQRLDKFIMEYYLEAAEKQQRSE